MHREEIRRHVENAIEALQAGQHSEALATLQKIATDLAPRKRRVQPPAVAEHYDQTDLDALHEAYRRAMAGTIDAQEVSALIHRLERLPVPQTVALARAIGCTWVPLRATRKAALAAITDRLLGPIHARERATF
mgnify:CR=1 FL=1|jgi:hypothetical protein